MVDVGLCMNTRDEWDESNAGGFEECEGLGREREDEVEVVGFGAVALGEVFGRGGLVGVYECRRHGCGEMRR